MNEYFDHHAFINDDSALIQLTDLCRTLNEDPVLEQIRIDNHVTYESRKEEEEKEYTPKTHSFIQEITMHEVTHIVKGPVEVHA